MSGQEKIHKKGWVGSMLDFIISQSFAGLVLAGGVYLLASVDGAGAKGWGVIMIVTAVVCSSLFTVSTLARAMEKT